MDEFTNIDNIYESFRPTIKSAMQLLKVDSENQQSKKSLLPFLGYVLKWLTGIAIPMDTQKIKQCVNQLIRAQSKQQETLVHVISILNATGYAAQGSRQKLNEIMGALQRSNEDLDRLFYITEVLTKYIRYQQMCIYMQTIIAYLRLSHLHEASCHTHDGLCRCIHHKCIITWHTPSGRPEKYDKAHRIWVAPNNAPTHFFR